MEKNDDDDQKNILPIIKCLHKHAKNRIACSKCLQKSKCLIKESTTTNNNVKQQQHQPAFYGYGSGFQQQRSSPPQQQQYWTSTWQQQQQQWSTQSSPIPMQSFTKLQIPGPIFAPLSSAATTPLSLSPYPQSLLFVAVV